MLMVRVTMRCLLVGDAAVGDAGPGGDEAPADERPADERGDADWNRSGMPVDEFDARGSPASGAQTQP
jgi:hypothetical protein